MLGRRDILKAGLGLAGAPLLARIVGDAGGMAIRGSNCKTVKIIAIEEHFLTPEVRDAWGSIAGADDGTLGLNEGLVGRRLAALGEQRLELMNGSGVDVQVLSLTSPGLNNLGTRGVELAARTNDLVARAVASVPERFQALAALPSAEPRPAARELERAVGELGFKGAILYGRMGEKNLEHEVFWPTFECAEALGVPLLLHPQVPRGAVRDAYYSGLGTKLDLALSTYGIGWHYEAGIQFVRAVLAGVPDRFPKLQFILGHWGEVVLGFAERLAAMDAVAGLARPFRDYLRQNLYLTASGMFSEKLLQNSVEIVGADRVLFSTDFPYQYRPDGGREDS
jgi:predicted TIM-barrel fold metal-dependent hydrolase